MPQIIQARVKYSHKAALGMAAGRASAVTVCAVAVVVCAVMIIANQQPQQQQSTALVQLLPQSQIASAIKLFSTAGKTDT
jgi:hypothetical protein